MVREGKTNQVQQYLDAASPQCQRMAHQATWGNSTNPRDGIDSARDACSTVIMWRARLSTKMPIMSRELGQ